MKFSQIVAVGFVALSVGAASAAQPSNVQPGGTLGTNPSSVTFTALGNGTSTYDFTLSESAPGGFFTVYDLKLTNLNSIFANPIVVSGVTVSGGNFSQTLVPAGDPSLTFGGLLAGSYQLSLTASSSAFLSALGGTATVVGTITPVPEAGSLAMAAAGLGVVGLIAARRRKALSASTDL